jgi:YegS/Rv2252/BmrU family lipid kinase
VNAAAGAGRTRNRWPQIARELDRLNLRYEARFTQGEGDATRLAEEAVRAGCSAVVAVGGDGTINEVLNGVMQAGAEGTALPAFGVLPSGTAQDFARSAGIPLEPRQAARALASPWRHPIDVGRIRFEAGTVRYFANYAGTGFDATVAAQARSWGHRLRGAVPYVLGFFAVLRGFRNPQFVISLDGESPLNPARRASMVVVANGANYAGVLRMAPAAALDDGLLDVVVIGDISPLVLLGQLPLAIVGRHLAHPQVSAQRARSVSIQSGEPVPVQSDGELVGCLPAVFEVLPRALQLLRPQPSASG